MTIEIELRTILGSLIDDSYADKQLTLDYIMYHYGFGDKAHPSLRETAERFPVSYETVRKTIAQYTDEIRTRANPSALTEIYRVMCQRSFWQYDGLKTELEKRDLLSESSHIEVVFTLRDYLKVPNDYCFYIPNQIRRRKKDGWPDIKGYVVVSRLTDRVEELLTHARKLTNTYGIVKANHFVKETGTTEEAYALAIEVIRHSGLCWTYPEEDSFWYAFEWALSDPQMPQTSLRTYSEKVFAEVESCAVQKLAISYANALSDRATQEFHVPVHVMEGYLQGSEHFQVSNGRVKFKHRVGKLSPIEMDTLEFLKREGECKAPELKEHLLKAAAARPRDERYSENGMQKAMRNSPLVFVDKSEGRGFYRFSWIGWEGKDYGPERERALASGIEDDEDDEDGESRKDRVSRTLDKLGSTDTRTEKVVRLEQHLLRRRLFCRRRKATCAICKQEYPVEALWVAHKKKRKDCTEAERKSSNVVMPLCVFGCDFLYERRYVRIIGGEVKYGKPPPDAESIQEYLEGIVGNVLEDRWQQGSEEYFAYGW